MVGAWTIVAVGGTGNSIGAAVTDYNTNVATLMAGSGTIWKYGQVPPVAVGFAMAIDMNGAVSIAGQFGYYSAT